MKNQIGGFLMATYYLAPWNYRRIRRDRPVDFNGGRRLPLDVQEDNEEYVITASVPGFRADDLHIEILDDVLTLRAEIDQDEVEKRGGYLLREIHRGSFSRSLRLPESTDAAKAEAKIEDGLLTVRVPKSEEARPKEIKVKAS
jgi:HSP20 family protein